MQALIHGTLDRLKRTSERLAISRASTLRARDGQPIDVVIEDISATGCRIRIPLPLAVEDRLMIGLAGVGARSCRVVWAKDAEVGCEFDTPLTFAEIEETRFARTLRQGRFPTIAVPVERPAAPIDEKRLGARHSLLIMFGAGAAAWLILCAAAVLAYQLLF